MAQAPTKRQQIITLQSEMAQDQADATKEFVELMAGDVMRQQIDAMIALRERMVPGSAMDQQLAGFLQQCGQMAQIATQYYQQMMQALASQG